MDIQDASSVVAWHDAASVLAAFAEFPTEELLASVGDGSLGEGLLAVAGALGCGAADGERLRVAAQRLAQGPSSYEDLRRDYTRLFSHPTAPRIPIYESQFAAWRSGSSDRPLLAVNRTATQLDELYRARGYRPDCARVVAADHLGAELAFLAILLEEVLDGREKGAGGKSARVEAEAFVRDHLGTWAPEFFSLMAREAATPEYALIGTFGQVVFGL